MPQSGFTPIQLYRSSTASATPNPSDLQDGELALNTNDGKLFYKDSSGNLGTLATSSGSASSSAITAISVGPANKSIPTLPKSILLASATN